MAHATVRLSVTTLVYVIGDGALLLLKRRKEPNAGLWSPPGGKLHPGESPLRCAVRELLEETGVTGTSPRLVAVVSEVDARRDEAWLMFVVRTDVSGAVPLRSSAEGRAAWIPLAEVEMLATPPADHHITRVVLDDLPGVAFLEVRFDGGRLQDVRIARG